MSDGQEIVGDLSGRPFMTCAACSGPLCKEDFWKAKLRLPEHGETPEEYRDAELIDDLRHVSCVSAPARVTS
jgi:hypothetical protein